MLKERGKTLKHTFRYLVDTSKMSHCMTCMMHAKVEIAEVSGPVALTTLCSLEKTFYASLFYLTRCRCLFR